METAITSILAGTLEFDTDNGFAGEVAINGGSPRTIWLHIFEGVSSEPGLLVGVAPIIDDFRSISDRAKSALGEILGAQDESVVEFIRFHVEDVDHLDGHLRDGLRAFLVGAEPQGVPVDFFRIRNLVFHRGIDGDLEFWLDFTLSSECSDEMLCVRFDADRKVIAIAWES